MISLKPCKVKWAAPTALKFGLSALMLALAISAEAESQEVFRADAAVKRPVPLSSIAPAPPPRPTHAMVAVPASPPPGERLKRREPAVMPSPLLASDVIPPSPPPSLEQQKAIAKIALTKNIKNGLPAVLPLITFFNSVEGDVYNWWAERDSRESMARLSQKVMTDLTRVRAKTYRYGVSAEAVKNMPPIYKKTALSLEEMRALSQDMGARILVSGDVRFSKSPVIELGYRMKVQAQAMDVATGTPIAEVLRISDLQKSEYERLFFSEVNQAGGVTIDAFRELNEEMERLTPLSRPQRVKLLISGNLNYGELEALKNRIKNGVKGVRAIYHGSYENEQVALMVDAPGVTPAQLGRALGQVQFGSFLTQVVSSDANQVLFDVKARRQ